MDKKEEIEWGPVQSHNPEQRIWEYNRFGDKIYKITEGYNKKTLYTKEHYWGTHFWKDRQ